MARIARFDEAKFGLFVHWGAYTVDGIEASWPVMLGPELQKRFVEALHRMGMGEVEMPIRDVSLADYEALPERFDPAAFDADAWVDLARDAGQRYLILTTKHHDGFAMFDTAVSDYGVTHGPFGRDVTGELAAACEAGGIAFGTYFSAPDIHDPGYRDLSRPVTQTFLGEPERPEWAGFLDRMEAQVVELCTKYGELFSMWWDIGFGPQWPIERFHGLVRRLQPQALLNDRLGGLAHGLAPELAADFLTPEQSVPRSIPRWSTFGGPMDPTMLFALIQRDDWEAAVEQVAPIIQAHLSAPPDPSVPEPADFLPWEACHTFGGAWAWAPDLTDFKTGAEIVVNLVEVASRGGNLLMNVGPRPDGTIQPEFQQALREVGRWLERNGEGIYGTTFGPVQGIDGVRSTADDRRIYLHLLGEPAGGAVRVRIAEPVADARVLGADAPVTVERDGDELVVALGRAPLDPLVTTIALDRA
jgi:alpha-L-fucosidase